MNFCKICNSYFYDCCNKGLGAFEKKDKEYIIPEKLKKLISCSVYMDKCLKENFPNDSRWDYAITYHNNVYFIEIHPRKDDQVDAVIKKAQWIRRILESTNFYEHYEKVKIFYWIFPTGKLRGNKAKRLIEKKIVQKNNINLEKDPPSAKIKR